MASSAVTAAAKQISKLLVDEAKYLYAVKGKVEALHDELTWMRSFLQDADSREQDEELIHLWVSQIRDFAYEAEDIVEKYVHRVSRHRQDGLWNTVKWFSCICCDFRAHHEIGSDLDSLKQKISDLCSRMQIYGVKNKSRGNPNLRGVMELRRSNSQFRFEEIVILRQDTDKLVEMLIGSDHKVICVSGMGGLGKTTLAKMVYADLKTHFDAQVWVYVSQQFQTSNIFKAILIKLGYINDRESTSINDLRDEELPFKVCEVLLEKRCLVVLDDVWNDEDSKRFRRLVVYMHKSSRSIQDLISEQNHHHVRSLLFFPAGQAPRKLTWTQRKVSGSLKLVRVLHFDNVCIRSLPDEIGDLIHLRYLSLKGTRVSLLPRSVVKLKYLQILDLRVCECIIVMLPNVLWKLERLKHLYLPNSWVLFECFDNTLKLRGLIQLETLINLRLEKCRVRDLLRLVKLRKVSLADYTVTDSKCLNSFLEFSNNTPGQLKRPLSLALDAKVISIDPGILSSNSQLQFHKLHISGKILLKLRYARIFPQDLKQLTLNESEFKDDPMPILERLPHLTELTLGQRTFLGATMVCTLGKFPQLAILRLVQLPNLQEWKVERGAMPNLKNLYIYSCEKLEMVPSELPTEVKIGCRPCVTGYNMYGSCCYMTQQAPAAS